MKTDLLHSLKSFLKNSNSIQKLLDLEREAEQTMFTKIHDFFSFLPNMYYASRAYLTNRFVHKTHSLTASKNDIQRGSWCDVGDRFLPCLFNNLVDFVEIELADCDFVIHGKKSKTLLEKITGVRRSASDGLSYLEWCMTVPERDSKTQAASAKEIMELYVWWVYIRPERKDPYDDTPVIDIHRINELDNEKVVEMRTAYSRVSTIMEQYDKEDTEMLIRLINIRNHLWT